MFALEATYGAPTAKLALFVIPGLAVTATVFSSVLCLRFTVAGLRESRVMTKWELTENYVVCVLMLIAPFTVATLYCIRIVTSRH